MFLKEDKKYSKKYEILLECKTDVFLCEYMLNCNLFL